MIDGPWTVEEHNASLVLTRHELSQHPPSPRFELKNALPTPFDKPVITQRSVIVFRKILHNNSCELKKEKKRKTSPANSPLPLSAEFIYYGGGVSGAKRRGGGGIKSYVIGNAICGAHNVAFMRWCTHRRA